jgi:hypothetical protein
MLGQYQPLSTLPPSFLTVPIPNLPVSPGEKALESFSSPLLFGGNDVSFPWWELVLNSRQHQLLNFFGLLDLHQQNQ